MVKEIKKCRICGNKKLVSIVHLGEQYLTGLFPTKRDQKFTAGPLELVKCDEQGQDNACGLLQLRHSFDIHEMYGDHYGYHSSLNKSMVEHLGKKVNRNLEFVKLEKNDLVIDIGSNDSTLLQAYPKDSATLLGIDPSGEKFRKFYPKHVELIPDFFSAEVVQKQFPGKKAKIITSIAMFYDLESPLEFMQQVYDVLDENGIWVFEQSYMPTMIERNAYDTICHEHLEYYGLKQIKWMTDKIGFKIIDVELNDVNGGSFSMMVAKKTSKLKEKADLVEKILQEEEKLGYRELKPYQKFKKNIHDHRDELVKFLNKIKKEGKTVFGYGASTKGNVILQFCKFTEKDIPLVAEVNPDKFGCFTPGTLIPIVSEKEAKAKNPDYFMVLPWHFKQNIINREEAYLKAGGKLIFPLPTIQTVAR